MFWCASGHIGYDALASHKKGHQHQHEDLNHSDAGRCHLHSERQLRNRRTIERKVSLGEPQHERVADEPEDDGSLDAAMGNNDSQNRG